MTHERLRLECLDRAMTYARMASRPMTCDEVIEVADFFFGFVLQYPPEKTAEERPA